ncbi:thiolase, C-terminal domain protein [Mycobacterium xenopi 4042]|uniref:Thiolase, C-terminal domain protein n=1 Tax=Mycobacterium xenopi 4042 TaxID=1299334 RepID=X7ZXE4_MYCXE|nr:thiolase, C-terminal domain protein [Mycobacterium xenopi 4042]
MHHISARGADPVFMLTGPIPATRYALEKTGLSIDDIDVVEINEAFAPVVLAWLKEIKADPEKVNPNGGAIALGHPLGATGAKLFATMLNELERSGAATGCRRCARAAAQPTSRSSNGCSLPSSFASHAAWLGVRVEARPCSVGVFRGQVVCVISPAGAYSEASRCCSQYRCTVGAQGDRTMWGVASRSSGAVLSNYFRHVALTGITTARRFPHMVRPESWIRLAGGSPVPVSTGAPGSRPGSSLRGDGLSGVSRASLEGASARAVAASRTLQPRQIHNRRAEPLMSR